MITFLSFFLLVTLSFYTQQQQQLTLCYKCWIPRHNVFFYHFGFPPCVLNEPFGPFFFANVSNPLVIFQAALGIPAITVPTPSPLWMGCRLRRYRRLLLCFLLLF